MFSKIPLNLFKVASIIYVANIIKYVNIVDI